MKRISKIILFLWELFIMFVFLMVSVWSVSFVYVCPNIGIPMLVVAMGVTLVVWFRSGDKDGDE